MMTSISYPSGSLIHPLTFSVMMMIIWGDIIVYQTPYSYTVHHCPYLSFGTGIQQGIYIVPGTSIAAQRWCRSGCSVLRETSFLEYTPAICILQKRVLLILSHLCFADLRFHDIDHFGPGDRDSSTMGIVPIVTPAEGKQLLLTRFNTSVSDRV